MKFVVVFVFDVCEGDLCIMYDGFCDYLSVLMFLFGVCKVVDCVIKDICEKVCVYLMGYVDYECYLVKLC